MKSNIMILLNAQAAVQMSLTENFVWNVVQNLKPPVQNAALRLCREQNFVLNAEIKLISGVINYAYKKSVLSVLRT